MKRLIAALAMVVLPLGCASIVASAEFDLALQAFERGDYARAIARADDAIRKGSDSPRLRILLGWSLYRSGDHAGARSAFELALKQKPRDANAYFAHEGLGWIAYKAGEHDGAIAAFNQALALVPRYANAHTGLGWVYLAKRDLIRAEANFASALAAAPGDPDARRGLGFVAFHAADWPKAIDRFRAILRERDDDDVTRSALAWSHYSRGDTEVAAKMFQDLGRRQPQWADPLAGQAWIAERQKRATDAKTLFRGAIEKSATYVATGPGAADFRALLVARPEWRDVWRQFAWALHQERSFTLAQAEFRTLVDRDARDADAQRGLGFTLYALRRYRDAVAPLERSLAANSDLPPVRERVEIPGTPGLHTITSDATSTLAWTHFHLGAHLRAVRLFRDATTRLPDSADAWAGFGWSLARTNEPAAAEEAFRRSLAAHANYPDAVAGLEAMRKAPR